MPRRQIQAEPTEAPTGLKPVHLLKCGDRLNCPGGHYIGTLKADAVPHMPIDQVRLDFRPGFDWQPGQITECPDCGASWGPDSPGVWIRKEDAQ